MKNRSPFPVAGCAKPTSANHDKVAPFYCYRDRTLSMLRRYFQLSMQIGRLPALLGREVFRARVTSYRMKTFEDAVIFVHDVERCLNRLQPSSQEVIARIVFEEYTFPETARALGVALSSVHQRYEHAIDELSRIFLQVRMMRPMGERPRAAVAPKKAAARFDVQACQEVRREHESALSCCG